MLLRRFLFGLALLYPMAAHATLPCSAYPFTLTNGTLADANQVMANFNNILTCVNNLNPLGVPLPGSFTNLRASLASPGTTITVNADNVIVATALNGSSYTLTNYSQSFNGGTTGAGGMDTGALPTSGWVALYAIYNPVAPATSILGTNCASACGTIYAGANMPAGYTASALLTVLATNATPAITVSYVKNKKVWSGAAVVVNTAVNNTNVSQSLTAVEPPPGVSVSGNLINNCGTTPGNSNVGTTVASDSVGNIAQTIAFNCVSISTAALQGVFNDLPTPTAQTLWFTDTVAGTTPSAQIVVRGYTLP
jgi:hypothetical protein